MMIMKSIVDINNTSDSQKILIAKDKGHLYEAQSKHNQE